MNRCVVALLCVSLFPWDCLAEEIKSQTVKKNQNEEVVMQNASNAKHDDAKKLNQHPDAQWFKTAGMGLFMHFGLSSVKGGELSWSMYKDYADGAGPSLWPPDSYYGLAQQFNPQNYDANIIMAAAARAGFKYAVLTVRHHDGYALWPSDYGDFSTKQYIGGRDLLRPYVEACRKYGIKVGFYYSPTDWHYNPAGWPWRGFPLADKNFEYTPWLHKEHPHFADMPQAELQGYMDQFYAYVKGQVDELLSRYGKIDLLWWDGYDWPGTVDIHSKDMVTFVYSLQPGIVLNPRYGLWSMGWGSSGGDFSTFEGVFPTQKPANLWEYNGNLRGHWAYTNESYKSSIYGASTAFVLKELVTARSWGGNYLPNVGPAPDGTMPQYYYNLCGELASWMEHSRESIYDVTSGPWPEKSTVPVTIRGDVWYLHAPRQKEDDLWANEWYSCPSQAQYVPRSKTAEVNDVNVPASVTLLRTAETLDYTYANRKLTVIIPAAKTTKDVDVIKVRW